MAVGDKLPVVMGREKAAPEGVATLDENGILAEAQRPNLAQVGGSNPNLLRNWDFRNPVNRNGQTEYIGSGSTIDQWFIRNDSSLKLHQNAVVFTNTSINDNWFYQKFEQPEIFRGKVLTGTALITANTDIEIILGISDTDKPGEWGGNNSVKTVVQAGQTVLLTKTSAKLTLGCGMFLLQLMQPDVLTVHAVKLELGPVQTLARQNNDDEWEIIDPPDYDLQYLLCSQYSPITGEWVGSQHSNENLLDNGYLVDPIIQRAETSWTVSKQGKVYHLDRWWNFDIGTYTIVENGITCDNLGHYCQNISPEIISFMIGKTITLSLLAIVDGTTELVSVTGIYDKTIGVVGRNALGHLYMTGTMYAEAVGGPYFELRYIPEGAIVQAAKLELGPVQTLAHKEGDTWVLNDPPPNKALELAKCQRYFESFSGIVLIKPISETAPNVFIVQNGSFHVKKRTAPAILWDGAIYDGDGINVLGSGTVRYATQDGLFTISTNSFTPDYRVTYSIRNVAASADL